MRQICQTTPKPVTMNEGNENPIHRRKVGGMQPYCDLRNPEIGHERYAIEQAIKFAQDIS